MTPGFLRAAAHELGHVAGFQAANIAIQDVRVEAHHAYVSISDREERRVLADPERAPGYLIAVLAGGTAETRWCNENGLPINPNNWAGDQALVKQLRRRHPALAQYRLTDLSRRADALVSARWGWITRHAPVLASRRRMAT